MAASNKHGRTLRATLCEIERGLFYVTYPNQAMEADILELPTYGFGTCASQVKQWMEKSIYAFGYATVIWQPVLPPSHSPAPTPAVSAARTGQLSGLPKVFLR